MPIRAAKSSHTHLITVGRAAKNDVAIADISISRFHAFFKRNSAGGFQLHDAGSTNGTMVNESSVCTKEAGPPTDVKSGDNIRFGQVVRRLSRSGNPPALATVGFHGEYRLSRFASGQMSMIDAKNMRPWAVLADPVMRTSNSWSTRSAASATTTIEPSCR